jgi:AcrR family transcriptional regulator
MGTLEVIIKKLKCDIDEFFFTSHPEMQKKLIIATLNLMDIKGARTITYRDIANQANVSHMTPYRHFDSKEEIFLIIALSGHQMLTKQINNAIKKYPFDPRKQFIQVGLNYYHFAIKHPKYIEIMFGLRNSKSELDDKFVQAGDQTRNAILRLIHNCQLKGILPEKQKAEELASLLWSLVHGFTVLKNCDPIIMTKLQPVSVIRKGINALLNGLAC